MRMWKVNPRKMCRAHLLGEHVEIHMFVGCLKKNKSVEGYIRDGLIEIHNLKQRHDELVGEMKRRGFNHNSPLPRFHSYKAGSIDIKANEKELVRRCPNCKF